MRERAIPSSLRLLAVLLALAIATAMIAGGVIYVETKRASRVQANAMTRGDGQRGRVAIARYGCGGCHVIGGITGANGSVGPDLTRVAERSEIAGKLPNDPDAMVRWLMHPQAIAPGSGMPEMGISQAEARDIAAFLYGGQ